MAAILDIETERIMQLWISMSPWYVPPSCSNLTFRSGGDVVKPISRWPPSLTSERYDFSMFPKCLLPSISSIRFTDLEKMSKMWKANNGRWMTDGRTTDDGRRIAGHVISLYGASNSHHELTIRFLKANCNLKVYLTLMAVCSSEDSISNQHKNSRGQY